MHNLYKFLSPFFCLLFVSNINAQEDKLENSILWKIEGNGLVKSSYIMGTIHMMCEEDFEIKDKILKAIDKTEDITLEVDFADPVEMTAMTKSLMGERNLTEMLTEEQASKLDILLKEKLNSSLKSYDQLSLLAVYSMLLTQAIACPSKKMWEMELISIAREQNKEVNGLEQTGGQIDFFTKAYPTEVLIEQLLIIDDYAEIFDNMVALYKNENIVALGEVVSDPRFMDENAEYWMLEYRNSKWLKKMPLMMQEKSQFFAVGSAHLIGKHGIISGLIELGYKVTPVYN